MKKRQRKKTYKRFIKESVNSGIINLGILSGLSKHPDETDEECIKRIKDKFLVKQKEIKQNA